MLEKPVVDSKINALPHSVFPLLLAIYELVNYLSIDAYLPAMPSIAKQFGVSNQIMQLTLTVFFLGNIVAQLLIGKLSMRYGRRAILIKVAGLLFITTCLLSILSTNIETLFVARFFQGIAVTFFIISGYGSVHALYTGKKVVKIIALMSRISIFSPALGPLLGAFILYAAGWRWIFATLLIIACLSLAALSHFMPETNENVTIQKQSIMKSYWQVLRNWYFIKPAIAWCSLYSILVSWSIVGPFFIIKNAHYPAIYYGFIQAMVFGAFICGNFLVNPLLEKYALKKISNYITKITGVTGALGLLLNMVFPYQLILCILFILPLNFSFGLGIAVFNRLSIESSTEPLVIKISLTTLLTNLSAFLVSIMVTALFGQDIFHYSILLFVLSFIAFVCSYYKKQDDNC